MKVQGIGQLVKLLRVLRGRKGCAWDREQSLKSITPYLVEEVYELIDAIEEGDRETLMEEMGDLLFLTIFASEIAREEGLFTLDEVIRFNVEKLKRRHPHVFKLRRKMRVGDVLKQWEFIKGKEKNSLTVSKSMRRPQGLPSLLEAYRIQEKASAVGFDWTRASQIIEKIEEELQEVKETLEGSGRRKLSIELGDLLFSIVNLARFMKIDPERSLRRATRKFVERFAYVEGSLRKKGKEPSPETLADMEASWEKSKRKERR